MKKIRCFLATIALAATLGGLSLQGIGLTASAAVSHFATSVSSQLAVGQLTRSETFIPKGPCPSSGSDC